VNYSGFIEPEGRGCDARDDDGEGPLRRPPFSATSGISPIRSAIATLFRRKQVVMAAEAGFVSAASAISGIVEAEGRTNLHVLPRVAWDGRQRSLRAMRVILFWRHVFPRYRVLVARHLLIPAAPSS